MRKHLAGFRAWFEALADALRPRDEFIETAMVSAELHRQRAEAEWNRANNGPMTATEILMSWEPEPQFYAGRAIIARDWTPRVVDLTDIRAQAHVEGRSIC